MSKPWPILDILKDQGGVYSCARVCAVCMIPALFYALYTHAGDGAVPAIVVGGIGSLSVRNLGIIPKPDDPDKQGAA